MRWGKQCHWGARLAFTRSGDGKEGEKWTEDLEFCTSLLCEFIYWPSRVHAVGEAIPLGRSLVFFFISFQNIIFKHWQNSNLKWVPKKSKLGKEQVAR